MRDFVPVRTYWAEGLRSSRAKPSTGTKDFSLLDLLPFTLPEAGFLRFAQNDTKPENSADICFARLTEGTERSIASPFENTQGRRRSFDFAQDDGKTKT